MMMIATAGIALSFDTLGVSLRLQEATHCSYCYRQSWSASHPEMFQMLQGTAAIFVFIAIAGKECSHIKALHQTMSCVPHPEVQVDCKNRSHLKNGSNAVMSMYLLKKASSSMRLKSAR